MPESLPITQVTVHPDGALVTRSGAVTPRDGVVVVRALPLLLDESSLRASLSGGQLKGLELDLDLEGLDRGEAPEPFRAWREADHAVSVLDQETQLLRDLRAEVFDLQPPDPDEAPEGVSPGVAQLKAWLALNSSLEARAASLDARLQELARALWEAKMQRQVAYDALMSSSSEQLWRSWAPTRLLRLEVEAEGPLQLDLSYRVEGARWAPAYTLRADAQLQEGRFVMRAVVAQVSGEDWRGVRLSLSSAPCARRVELPELAALRLGVAQAAPRPAWRPLPPGLDALFPQAELSEPTPPSPPPAPRPKAHASPPPPPAKPTRRDAPEPQRAPRHEEPEALFDDDDDGAPMELSAGDTMFFGAVAGSAAPTPAAAMPMPMAAPQSAPPPPPAPMREEAVSRSRSMLPSPKRKKMARGAPAPDAAGGAPPGATPAAPFIPAPPVTEEPAADILDYPRLRLADYTAPRGKRGRLAPVDATERAQEAGLPQAGVARLRDMLNQARRRAREVRGRHLPAHHVVPGPVDGAFARYEARGEVDIPSDGGFVQVACSSHPARLELRYRAVAREDPRVFRRLLAKLDVGGPLLPGPVDIYVGGSLVRSFPLAAGSRGAVVTLGMGAEDGLKLARNVRYREESAGMFRGSRRLHTEIDVEVASSLQRAVEIELLERLPIAGDDEVEVRLVASTPEAEPWKGDKGRPEVQGGHVQRLTVPAGGLSKALFHYSVTMDNKMELMGGDRRG